MGKFCKDFREHTMRMFNYEKEEVIPLTDEENTSYEEQKVCYICKKNLIQMKTIKMRLNYTIKSDNCHYTRTFRGSGHSICNLR